MKGIDFDEIEKKASKRNIDPLEVYGDDYLDKCLSNSVIDVNEKYQGTKFILLFEEEGKSKVPVLSLGNISATIGGAKSKKTFFSTMISSAFVSDNKFAMHGYLNEKKLLYVDTEQSKFHVQKIAKRIEELNGGAVDTFDILALREHPEPELRCAIIEFVLKNNKGKYCMVVIDGLVDLINDFNDVKESGLIVNKIMSWSEIYGCHINCIIHTNKDKRNARGHLGTALMNKSETIFRVSVVDGGVSKVECEASRNRPFKKFEFFVDNNGLPCRNDYPSGYYNNNPEQDPSKKDTLPF